MSDTLKGIAEAVKSVYPLSDHQKCPEHKVRNHLSKLKYKDQKKVNSALEVIYMAMTKMQARKNFDRLKMEYHVEYPQVVSEEGKNLEDLLNLYQYPYEIRRMLATTNFIESINSQIRKVIYGKRIFPTDEALLKVCSGITIDLEEKEEETFLEMASSHFKIILRLGYDLG